MKLPQLAVNRPVSIVMVVLIAILLGVVSLSRLAIDLLPDLKLPISAVITSYSGAGPKEVENLVSKPLEEAMETVNNVKTVRSITQMGSSIVIVEYDWGTDMDFATLQMREKIDRIKGFLPDDVDDPMVVKFDPTAIPVMGLAITGSQNPASLKEIGEDTLKNRLERLEGVASVEIQGGLDREIRIEVDPHKMEAYQLSFNQLSQVLRGENMNFPGGTVEDGQKEFLVRTTGEFNNIEEIKQIPITSPQGTMFYLSDIATIKDGYGDITQKNKANGVSSIALYVKKQSNANTVKVCDGIRAELERLKPSLPQNMNIVVTHDLSTFIKQAIKTVVKNALVGALLAIIILYLFLRNIRSTFVVGISIPVSVITTFILIYFSGLTLNLMSLGGLALGVGMLVDNAIVVLENIYRYRQEGYSQMEAAKLGASEVGMAVTASTLTTMAVFLPIVYVEGMAAQIFRELAMTVSFSLLASLIMSLSLVPMLASKILKVEQDDNGRQEKTIRRRDKILQRWDDGFTWLTKHYQRLLNWALDHRRRILLIVGGAFVGSLLLIPFIGAEFMPDSDEGVFTVAIELPQGVVLQETEKIVNQVERTVLEIPEMDVVETQIGSAGGEGGPSSSGSELGEIKAQLVPKKERKRDINVIINELRDKVSQVPGAKITVTKSQQMGGGSSSGSPVTINLKGEDLDTLIHYAHIVKEKVKAVPGTTEVDTSIGEGRPELQIIVDRVKAADYGLGVAQIGSAIHSAVAGDIATKYRVDGDEIDVRLRFPEAERETIHDLGNILITAPNGLTVPVKEVAKLQQKVGPSTINRENQTHIISVTSKLRGRSLGEVIKDIQLSLTDLEMPQGYELEYGGQNKDMMESFKNLGLALIMAIILVYMILAAQFESLVHPLTIMFSVPLALIGALLGLFVTRRTINVTSMIGIIMLAGIVVNNAIVLVDYVNTLRREGMARRESILKAGLTRMRPILMTAMTTVLGLIPLALGIGEGAEADAPMATVVIGGLLFSTLLTLLIIPIVYTLFDDMRTKDGRARLLGRLKKLKIKNLKFKMPRIKIKKASS